VNASQRRHWTILFLVAFAVCLVPSSALAKEVWVVTLSLGAGGSGDGQVELSEHSGLAVNETNHDIYVADTGNHRVVQFDLSGSFIRAFGGDVGGAGVNVCTSGCGEGTPESAPGAFIAPSFIAIDNSGGSSDGDVYVADTAAGLVSKFEADGTLATTWGSGGQLDGSTATGGPFAEIAGIAVDSTGTLDVLEVEPQRLFKFDETGAFSEEIETPRGTTPAGLAVDLSGNFFKANGDLSVERFEGSGAGAVQVNDSFSTTGLAVDPSNGELYIDKGGSIDNYAFGPFGEVIVGEGSCLPPSENEGCPPTETFGAGDLTFGAGLAVDGTSRTVYAADSSADEILAFEFLTLPDSTTEAASAVGIATAILNGTVNPDGAPLSECFFEWGETESYGNVAPCEEPDAIGVGEGSAPVPVHADVAELKAGTTYHFRLLATNANGTAEGEDEEFKTLGPSVSAGTAFGITASEAKISGEINPNGLETTFDVEYVTEAQFLEGQFDDPERAPDLERNIGSGGVPVKVIQQLSGLLPGTTYHFRLVATNADAETAGPEGTFTTFNPPGDVLPDGRAYEMVSPPQKAGEVLPPEPGMQLGGRRTSICPTGCLPGVNVPQMPMQSTPDGKAIVYEGQPFSAGLASGPNEYLAIREPNSWNSQSLTPSLFRTRGLAQGYKSFSADLSVGVVYQIEPALSPQAPVREDKSFANLYLRTEDGLLEPLVTEEPPNRDPGFDEENGFKALLSGANSGAPLVPAFSHIVFEANDALTDEVPGIAPDAPEVAVGEPCSFPGATCNLYEWIDGELRLVNVLPGNTESASGAVIGSARQLATSFPIAGEGPDVDHAVSANGSRIFWSREPGGQVYVRIDGEETVEIQDPGKFVTASADGSKVLLSNGCLYDLDEEGCEDLTLDQSEVHQGGFQGILGAAEDLSGVYFVDTAVLTGEEENANEEQAETGEYNLYAWEEGATSFIGTLLEADNRNGKYGDWRFPLSNRTAQVSPDGRYLAFMSQAPLTGYDNQVRSAECRGEGAVSTPCYEVFEYDATSGSLSCASCNPSGQRPLGQSNLSLITPTSGMVGPQPGNLPSEGEGVLFFESQDELSSRDTNGAVQDIYQWKPEGAKGCGRAGGCVALISSGHGRNDSMFVNATPSADDVFFITREQLVPEDQDEQLDIYDARVGGGFEDTPETPCVGKGCKNPVSNAPSVGGASIEFRGPRNPNPKPPSCKRGFVRKHGKCVKKHKKHKKHQERSAKHHRRGS
jgi:hypothetical protein